MAKSLSIAKPGLGQIKDEILRQVTVRGVGKTICPSEVARALVDTEPEWRALMPDVRRGAVALSEDGQIVMTKKGIPVSGTDVGGPIRLGLPDP